MKINYASLHNMNDTHISFRDIICKQKINKRKNNVVRGFKRNYQEAL